LASVPAAETFGNYTLIRHLAMGGMGEVWLANQSGPAGFTRPVVIKRVLRSHNADGRFIELFLNEARLAARLTHPNIVQVIELGQQADEWFMAMEYIHGKTMRALQRTAQGKKERLPVPFVAAVASQALMGLHYAHRLTDENGVRLGVVHRDVSPDNLMVSFDGVVKVLDFGIAKASTAVSSTVAGAVRGKASYVSPEHIRGEPLDGRADVFSLGVVMYELLTGSRPFVGDSDAEKMMQVLTVDPKPLDRIDPSIPKEVSQIVLKAVAKKREDRFATAEAMHLAIEQFLADADERTGPVQLASALRLIAGEPDRLELSPPPVMHTRTFDRGDERSLDALSPSLSSVPSLASAPPPPTTPIASPHALPAQGTGSGLGPAGVTGSGLATAPSRALSIIVLALCATAVVALSALILSLTTRNEAPGDPSAPKPFKKPNAAPTATTSPRPGQNLQAPAAATAETNNLAPTAQAESSAEKPAFESKDARVAPMAPSPTSINPLAAQPVAPKTQKPTDKPPEKTTLPDKSSLAKAKGLDETKVVSKGVAAGPGRIRFLVRPWAEIYLDGESLGITPMEPVKVPPGKSTFVLKNERLRLEKRVTVMVKSGQTVEVREDLTEALRSGN
jgi:serine/threonine-protein kinase